MAVDISQNGLQWEASIDLTRFEQQFRDIQTRLGQLANTSNNAASQIDAFTRRAASAIGAYISLAAGQQFAADIVRVRGEFQQLQIAFETMLQSKSRADQLFKEAVTLAAQTPLELKDVAGATKQLLAYGASVDNVVDEVKMLGDVAAGVGQPLQEITYLYGTLRSQGRAYAMDIRQFAGRGIPIIGELAKQFGVSATEVNKLVEAGKVGFPEIEKAFKSLTSSGGIFNNMLEAQSRSITGQIAKLSDAWDLMLNDIGKSQEGFIGDVINTLAAGIENYQTILDTIKAVITVYGTYKAAVIATVAVQTIHNNMVKGYTILEQLRLRAMILSEAAMKVLNRTMLSNPAVAVATGIAALTAAFLLLRKETADVVTSVKYLSDAQRDANAEFTKQSGQINRYVEILNSQVVSERSRLNAYNELKKLAPQIIGDLDFQRAKTADLTSQTETYIATLRQQILLEKQREVYQKAVEQRAKLFEKTEEVLKRTGSRKETQTASYDDVTGRTTEMATEYGKAVKAFREADRVVVELEKNITNAIGTTAEAMAARIESLRQERSMHLEGSERYKEYTKQIFEANKAYAAQLKLEKDAFQSKPIVRNRAFVEKEIERIKALQDAVEVASKEYIEYQRQIDALNEELNPKKTGRSQSKVENELNRILEKRVQILQSIADFERDAKQSSMLKQASEIDRINERYEEQVRLLNEANAEITKYNKKNPNSKKALFGDDEIKRLQKARDILIQNERYEDEAQKYIELAKLKARAFEDYRKVEEQGNAELTAAAQDLYNQQMEGFDNYLEYLKNEAARILPKLFSGTLNKGDALKLQEINKQITEETNRQEEESKNRRIQNYTDLLSAVKSYNVQRAAIERKYSKLAETLELNKSGMSEKEYQERAKALERQRKLELESMEITFAETSDEYKKLTDYILVVDRKVIKSRIANLEAYMKIVAKTVGKESAYYKQLEQDLNGLKIGLNENDLETFQKFSDLASKLGDAFSEAGGELENIGGLISGLASQTQNLSTAFSKTASDTDKIAAGIGAAVDMIMMVVNASNKRKAAEEAYYASVIAQQSEYNILLNEQMGMMTEVGENVFVKNYEGRIADSFNQLKDANDRYLEAIEKLQEGQAKLGQKNKVDWGAVGQGAASGAVLGATVGGWIGAAIGAVVGGVVGLFAGKKKGDLFGDLLTEYPELVREAANGYEELNVELAKTLVQQDLVDAKTKELLESAIAWTEQIAEAKEQMKNIIAELSGGLGNSLRDSLVNAFKEGTDAAQAFSENVSKVLEDMLSQLIFSKVFTGAFDQLEEEMMKSFDFGGDGSWVDDFGRFFAQAEQLTEEFNKNLEQAQDEAAKFNIDIFKRNQQTANAGNGLSGAIKGITAEQGDLLAGQFGGLRMTAMDQLKVANNQLTTLNGILYNTSFIELSYKILAEFKLAGIKIKP